MTFSDFMKILYTYAGDGLAIPEFIIHITDQIMEESCTKETTQSNANGKCNPLSVKSNDMLYKIYRGDKALPKKDAQIIFKYIDPDRFRSYLLHFSDEAIAGIGSKLRDENVEIEIDDDGEANIENTCIKLFVSIIKNSCKQISPKQKTSKSQKAKEKPHAEAQLSIPNECRICFCCENWKGNMQDAYNNTFGTLGRCQLYSKEILSTEGTNCAGFMPAYGHISHYQLMNKFSRPWKNL